jgi:DNA polymerase
MFIGEAPGMDEDLAGLPFVGQSGQLLDAILSSINLTREQIYIANIIPWRPPGNRPPTATELTYCLPYIERHIALIKPKVIVLLGGVATKALLRRNDGILKLRNNTYHYEAGVGSTDAPTGIVAMPTFHPAYIMRSPSQKAHVWRDMLNLKAMLDGMQLLVQTGKTAHAA